MSEPTNWADVQWVKLSARVQKLEAELTSVRQLARRKHDQLWSIKINGEPIPTTNDLMEDEQTHTWLKDSTSS